MLIYADFCWSAFFLRVCVKRTIRNTLPESIVSPLKYEDKSRFSDPFLLFHADWWIELGYHTIFIYMYQMELCIFSYCFSYFGVLMTHVSLCDPRKIVRVPAHPATWSINLQLAWDVPSSDHPFTLWVKRFSNKTMERSWKIHRAMKMGKLTRFLYISMAMFNSKL